MSFRLSSGDAPDRGCLFVVSGPSGVGKSTLVTHAMASVSSLEFSVSATTRPARVHERDGEHYHFVSAEEFARREEAGHFLEHALVYGHRYGTLATSTEEALSSGRSLLLDIDVQGAAQVRSKCPDAVSIFIAPPNLETLRARLEQRAADAPKVIQHRMQAAGMQLSEAQSFDYLLVNDDLPHAIAMFCAIFQAELSRSQRRRSWSEALVHAARLTGA